MENVTEERVIGAIAEVAFAEDSCDVGCGSVVKPADRLRALEMLYRYLGLGEKGGALDGVTIVDGGSE